MIDVVAVPLREVRAVHTVESITVYQAYAPEIATAAVAAGRFVAPFRRERMTWIKPSFLWMMYRCGWATKPGQERVLAVELTRAGFEWALAHACLSHFDPALHADRRSWSRQLKHSPVRVQWDPERSPQLQALPYRSLQVGLSGEAVDRYVDDWIVGLTDITEHVHALHGDHEAIALQTARERPYPLPAKLAATIDATAVPP